MPLPTLIPRSTKYEKSESRISQRTKRTFSVNIVIFGGRRVWFSIRKQNKVLRFLSPCLDFYQDIIRVGNDIAANIPYFLISIPFITPFLNPFARRQSFVTVHYIRKRRCLQISWTLEKGIKYIMNIRKGFKISSLTNFSENLLPNGLFYLASGL